MTAGGAGETDPYTAVVAIVLRLWAPGAGAAQGRNGYLQHGSEELNFDTRLRVWRVRRVGVNGSMRVRVECSRQMALFQG